MRPRRESLCPIENVMAAWIGEGLDRAVEGHLLAVGRAVKRELRGASIMQRGAGAAWLTLYRRLREDTSGGALTAARGLSELVRAGRALGLVGVVNGRPMRAWQPPPPYRRRAEAWRGDGAGRDDAGDEAAVDEARDEAGEPAEQEAGDGRDTEDS